ncbi:succinate-semialdehyde dehydrogenase/glutarate-semialdehyde dehydrogenase [Georgenia soli]|uniref:Succinate-semialdehyde dehydrogenase/glutarate-semialdehyde dehydrogenase n=1 Tax=Georgenia soli TaxID=638953 RepID=A0A2A9EPS7_9MICO|nr:NAD-dependent succinate-semialdehyde dehydrogenase [Georgenia soli]PFG41107.1 succinate-semialdehyde dehydrogenase/glutarate-semialdehyde dehydrogenase [Georgenia soli]
MPQITTVNPATGETLATYKAFTPQQVEAAVAEVHAAQPAWAALDIAERASRVKALGAAIRSRREELARLAVNEMGKPIGEALAEVDKCAWVCDYYAEHGPGFLADREVTTDAERSWVSYEPLGVVLAIMPWNFPYWQVLRFAAPTLLAGNTALLKHSPNVTGCALAIEQLVRDAGLPDGVLRTLVIAEDDVPATTASLLADDRVAAVTLTGSERAGSAVAAEAGRHIKKSLLELGGSDPFVVLDDADLDTVVAAAVKARFINSGQSCLAAKRFIVHEAVVAEFLDRYADAVDALTVGDPSDPGTNVGPLAREDLATALERQVTDSVAMGATVRSGGARLERPGAWFAPTVLADVDLDMPVMQQETFGPVAAVVAVRDDEQAAQVADATTYGLGASVWSADPNRALAVGKRITSGAMFVNAVVASDPRLPFGGTRRSGYGRELGEAGALEFTNARTYYVGAGTPAPGPATE